MRTIILAIFLILSSTTLSAHAQNLPARFVYLRDVAPDIVQDIRYAGWHNFLGRPVKGYEAAECILTLEAAKALKAVQEELNASGLGLKVYDGYRPKRSVADFVAWSRAGNDQIAKAEFYPAEDKKDFFDKGYVALKSGHSRGSTVDLTIVPWPPRPGESYTPGQELKPCNAPYDVRFNDGTLDMGTGFDCMDPKSAPLTNDVPFVARHNRLLLRSIMEKHGFAPYEAEWWHFTLKKEPFPDTYFDFPVAAPAR